MRFERIHERRIGIGQDTVGPAAQQKPPDIVLDGYGAHIRQLDRFRVDAHGQPHATFGDDVVEHLDHLVFMQDVVALRPLLKKAFGRAGLFIYARHMHDSL